MSRKQYLIPALCIAAALLTACRTGTAPSAGSDGAAAETLWSYDEVTVTTNTVTIINRRKSEMYALSLSPSSEERWSENLIGEYPLPVGGELDAEIPVSSDPVRWDIRLEDQYHENVEIHDADLSSLTDSGMVMELTIEGGEDKVFIYHEITSEESPN